MINEVRFGWIGEKRRSALQALIATQLDDWAGEWWIGHVADEVSVRTADDVPGHDKKKIPQVSSCDTGALALYLGNKDFDGVGRYLAATSTDADIELARRVGEEALNDLAARIHRRAGVAKAPALAKATATLGLEHARLGAVALTMSVGRLQLELVLDRRLVDRLMPPAAAKSVSLTSRQVALETAPLQVIALMDFGSVDLAHLSDLSVGEILIGDRKLEEALQIHLEGRGAIATGYLRRLGEQRAVMFDGVNTQEKHQP
ncbi:MAG: hypothetical protein WA777_08480 [Rhodanobacter sp.]